MNLASTTLVAHLPDDNKIHFHPFSGGYAEMIRDVYMHRHYDFLDLKSGDLVFRCWHPHRLLCLESSSISGRGRIVIALELELENYKLLKENVS